MRQRHRIFVGILSLLGVISAPAQIVWVGGSGSSPYDIYDNANWASPLAKDGSDYVEFGVVTAGLSSVSVPSGVALHDILINNSGGPAYVFSGPPGDLRFNGDLTAAANANASFASSLALYLSAVNHTFNIGTGATISIAGGLHDYTTASSLTKTGAGTLTLADANDYSGNTVVNGGTLAIGSSSSVSDNLGRIGIGSTDNGTVTVQGSGSSWTNAGYLYVGEAGSGSLVINTGGIVSAANISIGNNSGGTGTVTLADATSSLHQVDTGANNGLFVGSAGTGQLSVSAGADVNSITGAIGNNTGGIGTVTVDGNGSTWANSGNLFVGAEGTGTLTVTNNGQVSSLNTTIGNNTGGTGTVNVTFGGALDNSGALRVAWQGTGTLSVTNGGTVTSDTAIIGSSTGGLGKALVSGPGSSWTNASNFFVGDYSSGTLTIAGSASVTIGGGTGTLTLGSNNGTGILNLGDGVANPAVAGGFLNAGTISTDVGGLGTVQFKTTATSASPYYFTRDGTPGATPVIINGPTDVIFSNGYNVIAASNGYTGVTVINGGTAVALYQAGSQHQFGSGNLTVNNGGTLALKGGPQLWNQQVTVVGGGKLIGEGSIANGSGATTTVYSGGTLAPGLSGAAAIGTLSFDDLVLQSGAIYEWNLQDPAGFAGSGWDLLAITTYSATLHIDSTTGSKLNLKLISLNGSGTPGTATGFASQTYNWKIFDGGDVAIQYVSGPFDPALFNIDSSGFVTNLGSGSFSLTEDTFTHSIWLNFTPVPEPSTYALMALGLAGSGLAAWRKRRRV